MKKTPYEFFADGTIFVCIFPVSPAVYALAPVCARDTLTGATIKRIIPYTHATDYHFVDKHGIKGVAIVAN